MKPRYRILELIIEDVSHANDDTMWTVDTLLRALDGYRETTLDQLNDAIPLRPEDRP